MAEHREDHPAPAQDTRQEQQEEVEELRDLGHDVLGEEDTPDVIDPSPHLSDSSDEEEFLDALDREVRHLEESGVRRGEARDFSDLDEARREVERAAMDYEEAQGKREGVPDDRARREEEEGKFEGDEVDQGAKAVTDPEAGDGEDAETEARRKREDGMTEEERQELKSSALSLKKEGNDLYASDQSEEAVLKYTEAMDKCPLCFEGERAIFAANRAAARVRLSKLDDALEDCHLALRLKPDYLKAYTRRGQIYEELDKPHEAMKDFEKVLEMDKDHKEARKAVQRLPPKIAQKDEEIKQEMFANLKKLGNMVLNPFGLSTNNFNFVQDPNTGSYSVNFTQNNS